MELVKEYKRPPGGPSLGTVDDPESHLWPEWRAGCAFSSAVTTCVLKKTVW